MAVRQDLCIAIAPEILEVIKNSTAISTQAGNSAHLLKVGSKRRRTKAEIEEFRQIQEQRVIAAQEKDARIRELEQELSTSKRKLQTAEQAESLVDQMLEAGALVHQEDGSYAMKSD